MRALVLLLPLVIACGDNLSLPGRSQPEPTDGAVADQAPLPEAWRPGRPLGWRPTPPGPRDFWVTRAGPVLLPLSALGALPGDPFPPLRVRLGDALVPVAPATGSGGEPLALVYVPASRPDGYSREVHLFVDLAPDAPSPLMGTRPEPTEAAPRATRIRQRRRVEPRDFWASYAPATAGGDFPDAWVGTRTHVGETATVTFAGLPATARATGLDLELVGGAVFAHRIEVAVGGVGLDAITFTGFTDFATSRAVPDLAPEAGAVTAALTLRSTDIADTFNVRAATLAVETEVVVGAEPLHLPCLETDTTDLVVPGAAGTPLVAWDVTDPFSPEAVTLGVDGGDAVLPGFAPDRDYLLFDPTTVARPDGEAALVPPETVLDASGTLLVVAPPMFHSSLAPWLEQVVAEGWTPVVRTPRELYQTFTAGRPTPAALDAYVRHALDQWATPPAALLLVGDASPEIDGGAPAYHVPTHAIYYPTGMWIPSDLAYAFPDWADHGGTGTPLLAVGRIPARTVAEADAAVARTLAHRQTLGRRVLYLSDDNDPSFRAMAELLRGELPTTLEPESLHLLDYDALYPLPDPAPPQWEEPAVEAMRADLRAALAGGVRLLQYFGHGDVNHVAGEGIFTQGAELDNLDAMLVNGGVPPIFFIHDCLSGNFGSPTVPHSIGEEMVVTTSPGRGMAAVISPSGYTAEPETTDLARALQGALVDPAHATLGAALAAAVGDQLLAWGCGGGACPIMVMSTNLLGDPTLPSLAATAATAP